MSERHQTTDEADVEVLFAAYAAMSDVAKLIFRVKVGLASFGATFTPNSNRLDGLLRMSK